jgi:hypothetical protein
MYESQRSESNRQPPHYECGALPIEATLASFFARFYYESQMRASTTDFAS